MEVAAQEACAENIRILIRPYNIGFYLSTDPVTDEEDKP